MTTTPTATETRIISLQSSPLASVETAFRQQLVNHRYAQGTQHQYGNCISHFAHWMYVNDVLLDQVSPDLVLRFVEEHLPSCTCPGRVQRHPPQVRAALRQLLIVLHDAGFACRMAPADEVEVELDAFDSYLRDQRGLADNTRLQRRKIVGDMLRHSFDDKQHLRPLDSTLLRSFLTERLESWSASSGAVVASALRAYYRFRAMQGDDVVKLLPVIASPACWKLSSLPETMSSEQIEQVLSSFQAPLASRRRGAAVAQCVARLGLRASEVVSLELDDIDWKQGNLQLQRCKSRRAEVIPMPDTVGAAIADYLQNERPTCISRRVFVRHVAPVEVPLLPSLVGRVIRDAYQRCGLPFTRVHIFRHSLAARVLDGGGTLKEVADLLGHRCLDTTQIYAKLDEQKLFAVTMPWPGSMS